MFIIHREFSLFIFLFTSSQSSTGGSGTGVFVLCVSIFCGSVCLPLALSLPQTSVCLQTHRKLIELVYLAQLHKYECQCSVLKVNFLFWDCSHIQCLCYSSMLLWSAAERLICKAQMCWTIRGIHKHGKTFDVNMNEWRVTLEQTYTLPTVVFSPGILRWRDLLTGAANTSTSRFYLSEFYSLAS